MKRLFLILIAALITNISFAQSNKTDHYKVYPVWIQLMEDPSVNYYEAVLAFDTYWENREIPKGEHELFSATNEEKEKEDFISNKKGSQSLDARLYVFEYKKFKHWQQQVLPFVKEDGHIMSKEEQLVLWNQQRKDRK